MKKTLFWTLSILWGLPLTLVGALVALFLIATGHKPHVYHGLVTFEIGTGWGGLNLGPFIITERKPTVWLKRHEAGHAIQNIILGPVMPFLIAIPSAVRYWHREYKIKRGNSSKLPAYDSIWFEGWATSLGEKYFKTEVK